MNQPEQASKLVQELFTFEKEFQYNLTLLKIKQEEVERCNATNKTLQVTVETNMNEISDLKAKVRSLEQSMHKIGQERDNEQKICETIINNLTLKLNETKRKGVNDLEEYENDIKRRCNELELLHTKNLNDRDLLHKRSTSQIQERLNDEIASITKLRKQLQSLMEENMTLRNKMRELESQYVPEITIYKNELKTIKSSNVNLLAEIEFLRKDYDSYHANVDEIKQLKGDLLKKTQQIAQVIQENNAIELKNNALGLKIQDCFTCNGDLMTRCNHYEYEMNRLQAQIVEFQKDRDLLEAENRRSVAEHISFTEVVKQNRILQEIVKSMRKEREALAATERVEVQEQERRVTRLEQLIDQLKQAPLESAIDCKSDTETENNDGI